MESAHKISKNAKMDNLLEIKKILENKVAKRYYLINNHYKN
jgi:hypothetical protein